LFNQPESVALICGNSTEPYWRRVLTYCAANSLQAMLDEYVHVLQESLGVADHHVEARIDRIAQAVAHSLTVRPSQIEVDRPVLEGNDFKMEQFQMRGRFAMRLADYKDDEGEAARLSNVRDAFNSPYRPFVLATSSIGQEGLVFHPYCYRVYHWKLPSNPVDLEQREGRVPRFRNHAVRLNVAAAYANELRASAGEIIDLWQALFDKAKAQSAEDDDLVPYWL